MIDGCRALRNIFECWGINLARAFDTNAFKHMAIPFQGGVLGENWKIQGRQAYDL
jgi:hypothetical protein